MKEKNNPLFYVFSSTNKTLSLIFASLAICFSINIFSSEFDLLETEELQTPDGLAMELKRAQAKFESDMETNNRLRQNIESQYLSAKDQIGKASQIKWQMAQDLKYKPETHSILAIRDSITVACIKKLISLTDTIFLAYGNPYSISEKSRLELLSLLDELKKKEVIIVYDADSLSAQIIESNVPKEIRVGISGRTTIPDTNRGKIYQIYNSYQRMEAILAFHRIVLSSDSILSVGLLTEQNSRHYS